MIAGLTAWWLVLSFGGHGGAVVPAPYVSLQQCRAAAKEMYNHREGTEDLGYVCAPGNPPHGDVMKQ